jgi:hypothetical protein
MLCTKTFALKMVKKAKALIAQGQTIRLTTDFLAAIIETTKQWNNIFNAKRRNCQSGILELAKLSFKIEGERKRFSDKV